MVRRVMRRVLAVAAIGVAAFALLSDSAGAQSTVCSATANGTDVTAYDSPGHALEVESDGRLQIHARVPGTSGDYQVKLEFAGVQWTVAHDSYTNGSWADSVDIATYAKRGVGIYKVVATSDSQAGACSTTAYIRVKGSPLSSTAGMVAAGAVLIGLAGVGIAGARAASVPDLMFRKAGPEPLTEAERDATDGVDHDEPDDERWIPPEGWTAPDGGKYKIPDGGKPFSEEYTKSMARMAEFEERQTKVTCSTVVVAGAGLTLAAMAHDGARTVVAMVGRVWR